MKRLLLAAGIFAALAGVVGAQTSKVQSIQSGTCTSGDFVTGYSTTGQRICDTPSTSGPVPNGSSGDILTSDGAGDFGTPITPGSGIATFLSTPSSANLRGALTDETGTGAAVFADSPTLVTPALGTPSSGNASNLTNIPVAQATGVLPAANGGAGTVSGIMKANGGGTVSAAAAGTDYAAAPSGSANTPLFNNGSGGFTNGTRSGNTTVVVTTTGSQTSGRCVEIDANGNHIQSAAACGTLTAAKSNAAIGWIAGVNPDKAVVATFSSAATVTAIRGTVDTAVGATATISIYKTGSGTACSSGTNLVDSAGTFNANGTAVTNQTLTVAGSGAPSISAGDRICLSTGNGANFTAGTGIGGITIEYTVP